MLQGTGLSFNFHLSTFNLELIVTLLILSAAFLALAYPLYRARTQALTVNASTLDDLLAERDGVYATLRDLELDKQLGKLDDADYYALHEKYMARAAVLLRELDTLRGEGDGKDASAEIEKEVAALRNKTTDNGQQTTDNSKTLSVTRHPSDLHCTNCGRPYKPGDKFCARCGRALS